MISNFFFLSQGTYFSENALLPGLVQGEFMGDSNAQKFFHVSNQSCIANYFKAFIVFYFSYKNRCILATFDYIHINTFDVFFVLIDLDVYFRSPLVRNKIIPTPCTFKKFHQFLESFFLYSQFFYM